MNIYISIYFILIKFVFIYIYLLRRKVSKNYKIEKENNNKINIGDNMN